MSSTLGRFKLRVETFLSSTGMKPSRLGSEALGDPNFVFEVRCGRKPNPDLMDRVDAYMLAYGSGGVVPGGRRHSAAAE